MLYLLCQVHFSKMYLLLEALFPEKILFCLLWIIQNNDFKCFPFIVIHKTLKISFHIYIYQDIFITLIRYLQNIHKMYRFNLNISFQYSSILHLPNISCTIIYIRKNNKKSKVLRMEPFHFFTAKIIPFIKILTQKTVIDNIKMYYLFY